MAKADVKITVGFDGSQAKLKRLATNISKLADMASNKKHAAKLKQKIGDQLAGLIIVR
jgi:hypothetical protein